MMPGLLLTIAWTLPLSAWAQSGTNYGPQLTQAAIEIQGAISQPCESNNACQQFVNTVIPRCQTLQGDAGCWCGNHDPLHNCALCMSSPSNNQTSADQMAAALDGHQKYHNLCNQFSASLNASSSPSSSGTASTSTASSTVVANGGSKTPVGAIVGGVIGGIIAIAVAVIVFIYWLRARKEGNSARPSNVSLFSAPASSTRPLSGYSHSPPPPTQMAYNTGFALPYNPQQAGVYSPPLMTASSFPKYPEPMTPGRG